MPEGFTFGFGADDIDDADQGQDVSMDNSTTQEPESITEPPKYYSLDDMLAALPASLSYALHVLPEAPAPLALPRRELFDIRAQLMSEADPTSNHSGTDTPIHNPTSEPVHAASTRAGSAELDAGLSPNDITPGIYEGGFKTWECATDLASYILHLASPGSPNGVDLKDRPVHIIELGTGTALPSTALLHALLSLGSPTTLTLTDYNASVLRLATAPNIILTALSSLGLLLPEAGDADIEPSASMCAALARELGARRVDIGFVSGAWGDAFSQMIEERVFTIAEGNEGRRAARAPTSKAPLTLILASETIYAPASLPVFCDVLVRLLGAAGAKGEARAFVAAKRLYFGVGGGVPEMGRHLEARGASWREVWASAGGVGRCVVEVWTRG